MAVIDERPLAELVVRARSLVDGDAVPAAGSGPTDPLVRAVRYDSRRVEPGDVFVCIPGARHDGHDHAAQAVERGAAALVVERRLDLGRPELLVADARRAMGPLAAASHDDPSGRLAVVGVTGTNGKTTTVHLLEGLLDAAGRDVGVIGTLTGVRTTPEAPDLQDRLADFAAAGTDVVAMEVSSHALDQHRVGGTHFAVAVFTNLSEDHLDYHGDMASYFEAKARLFDPGRSQVAVVNTGTPEGRELADRLSIETVRYSLAEVERLTAEAGGSSFTWRGREIHFPLMGDFNVANAIGAAEAAVVLGVDIDAIAAGLAAVPAVPGRFEPVVAGQPFTVVVDYAHTPDGLDKVLAAARGITDGRVLVVFGCGGDRDRAKRPLMGAAAQRGADLALVTSDNPRSEDPDAIIAAVLDGMTLDHTVVVEPDRRRAIDAAVDAATAGDIVVLAGKGHETTQTIGAQVLDFDDRIVVLDALASRGWGSGS